MSMIVRVLLLSAVAPMLAGTVETWEGPWLPWPEDPAEFYLAIIPPTTPGMLEPLPQIQASPPEFLDAPESPSIPMEQNNAPIPEPASVILVGAGLIAAALFLAPPRRKTNL